MLKGLQFLALILLALAMAPAGAHLFALPNKIDLPEDRYFAVQAIYRGWALLGIVLVLAIVANLALTVSLRGRGLPFVLSLAATAVILSTLIIFFVWTYPANQATRDWTIATDNWRELRTQWEYAHAACAVLTFVALCCATLSVLTSRP